MLLPGPFLKSILDSSSRSRNSLCALSTAWLGLSVLQMLLGCGVKSTVCVADEAVETRLDNGTELELKEGPLEIDEDDDDLGAQYTVCDQRVNAQSRQ